MADLVAMMEKEANDSGERFLTATQVAKTLKVKDAVKLAFYGLCVPSLAPPPPPRSLTRPPPRYKQSTVGDNDTKRPGMFDMVGKAKWDAWDARRGTNADDAMDEYVDLVNEHTGVTDVKASGGGGGGLVAAVSVMAVSDENAHLGMSAAASQWAGDEGLLEAASAGDPRKVAAAIAAGADLAGADAESGSTALHFAADRGALDCVAALLEAGAAVDAADADGATPLACAALCGHADVVVALLAAGADPEAEDHDGETAAAHAQAAGGAVATAVAAAVAKKSKDKTA